MEELLSLGPIKLRKLSTARAYIEDKMLIVNLNKTYKRNEHSVVSFEDLKVEHDFEEAIHQVDVNSEVLVNQTIVELHESPGKSESGILVLVSHDTADELSEFLVSNVLETILILEVVVGEFKQAIVACDVLALALLHELHR